MAMVLGTGIRFIYKIRFMNGRPIGQRFSAARSIVYSDSSDLGVGGGGEGNVKGRDGVICYLPWMPLAVSLIAMTGGFPYIFPLTCYLGPPFC